jgi:hypothetical protein
MKRKFLPLKSGIKSNFRLQFLQIPMSNTPNSSFDPITFLEIKNVPEDKYPELRQSLYQDIIQFLLEKFTDPLTDEELIELENDMPKVQTYEQVIELIQRYDPQFEEKRAQYLDMYKMQFAKRYHQGTE